MPFFRQEDLGRLDWRLLQNGFINLYWRINYLDEDVQKLEELNYRIARFDCSSWKTMDESAVDISSKLNIQWNGKSLDALNDLLTDIDIPFESGFVLVFSKYDLFQKLEPKTSWPILDILASNGRLHLLFGKRLICMVQVDEPTLNFQPVGAQAVLWNPREWLNKDRGL
ncbi:MAG TPA: barstar family protein [Verrucomicrobiae bacterium]|nr:barstar family protein [Verrucomicrobiae bacterium]